MFSKNVLHKSVDQSPYNLCHKVNVVIPVSAYDYVLEVNLFFGKGNTSYQSQHSVHLFLSM